MIYLLFAVLFTQFGNKNGEFTERDVVDGSAAGAFAGTVNKLVHFGKDKNLHYKVVMVSYYVYSYGFKYQNITFTANL